MERNGVFKIYSSVVWLAKRGVFSSLSRSLSLYKSPILTIKSNAVSIRKIPNIRPNIVLLNSLIQLRYYAKKKSHKIELTQEENNIIDMNTIKEEMETALKTLRWEYTNTVTLRLTPIVIGTVKVKIGQKQVPISEVGQLSMPTQQNITINFISHPSYISDAVKELKKRFYIKPLVEGSIIKITIPKPSKELRENLCKDAKGLADKAKVMIRRVRQTSIAKLRKETNNVSKDSLKRIEDAIQLVTDDYSKSIEKILKTKTDELRNT